MPTVQLSNYKGIEHAIANLISAKWPGMPVELGDFSKITTGTPCAVITHGSLSSPLRDRNPQYEWLHWSIPIHFFFDYTNDAEAHELFRSYRVDILALFEGNRYLNDTIQANPPGYAGQAIDCKITRALAPMYFTLDGKTYVQSVYELWVAEKVYIQY